VVVRAVVSFAKYCSLTTIYHKAGIISYSPTLPDQWLTND
jgi:hypothetical protein